jgi:hypothetical protein
MVADIDAAIAVLIGKPKKYSVQSDQSTVLAEQYDLSQLLQLRRYYSNLKREELSGFVDGKAFIGTARIKR